MVPCIRRHLKEYEVKEVMASWSFLSNHGAILVLVATEPRIKATEIGAQLGITERPVRRIISELEAEGYISKTRDGRSNRYAVNPALPVPGPVIRDLAVGDLLDILQVRSAGVVGPEEQA